MVVVYNQKAMEEFVHSGDKTCHVCEVHNSYYSEYPENLFLFLICWLIFITIIVLFLFFFKKVKSFIKRLNKEMS